MHIEKVRTDIPRAVLLYSADPYCLSKGSLDIILGADADERKAYLVALVKNAQQVVKYILPGLVGDHMNEKVLTSREVFPADDVKLHLGLTGGGPAPTPKRVSWQCKIICIISLISIILIILQSVCYVGRFPSNYERFWALYRPNRLKNRNKRNGVDVPVDESKQCPFVGHYDGHVHNVLANMRRLDGTIENHRDASAVRRSC
jgi:hypothetical protein